jgi:MFS family permease
MAGRLRNLFENYPRQFWLMVVGIMLSHGGVSMIWPFLLIYTSQKLELPLITVATLLSINATTGLVSSLIAGSLADKVGRKVIMNVSLSLNGVAFLLMMGASTYVHFLFLMIMIGMSNPLYQVGADAMLADMIPAQKRADAYSINRIAGNAAFALGAAFGGFMASVSYTLVFVAAGTGYLSYSLILLILAHETLERPSTKIPEGTVQKEIEHPTEDSFSGYGRVFRDKSFVSFVLLMGLGLIPPLMLWMLLPVYVKTGFGIVESQYGWIPTTNALMCVFVQYSVTQITRKFRALPVVAMGILVYAFGAGSVALMSGFWGFWLSMVILTFGELIVVPTASKYVADLAPVTMRGRYMSLYWLGWGLARAAAPMTGGLLNDGFSPKAIWIGGLSIGLASTIGLFIFSKFERANPIIPTLQKT